MNVRGENRPKNLYSDFYMQKLRGPQMRALPLAPPLPVLPNISTYLSIFVSFLRGKRYQLVLQCFQPFLHLDKQKRIIFVQYSGIKRLFVYLR